MTILLIASCFVGNMTIGDPNVSAKALTEAFQTPEALKAFLLTLSPEQMLKISQWNILILLMFLPPLQYHVPYKYLSDNQQ